MTDASTVRAVVYGLILIGFGGLAGVVLLAAVANPVPELLGYVITTSLGALAGILAKTSTGPDSVRIDQPASDPVPTTETKVRKKV